MPVAVCVADACCHCGLNCKLIVIIMIIFILNVLWFYLILHQLYSNYGVLSSIQKIKNRQILNWLWLFCKLNMIYKESEYDKFVIFIKLSYHD